MKGAGRKVLPAPLRTRGHGHPSSAFWPVPQRQVLVVWLRERQTRYHLFVRCRRWTPEIRQLWQDIERSCGPRAPSVRFVFRDTRATTAVLDFLGDTGVGKMPGLALFGFQGEESDLEEIELVASEEGSESDNEENGPGPP